MAKIIPGMFQDLENANTGLPPVDLNPYILRILEDRLAGRPEAKPSAYEGFRTSHPDFEDRTQLPAKGDRGVTESPEVAMLRKAMEQSMPFTGDPRLRMPIDVNAWNADPMSIALGIRDLYAPSDAFITSYRKGPYYGAVDPEQPKIQYPTRPLVEMIAAQERLKNPMPMREIDVHPLYKLPDQFPDVGPQPNVAQVGTDLIPQTMAVKTGGVAPPPYEDTGPAGTMQNYGDED